MDEYIKRQAALDARKLPEDGNRNIMAYGSDKQSVGLVAVGVELSKGARSHSLDATPRTTDERENGR